MVENKRLKAKSCSGDLQIQLDELRVEVQKMKRSKSHECDKLKLKMNRAYVVVFSWVILIMVFFIYT